MYSSGGGGIGGSTMYQEGSYERQLSRAEQSTSHKLKNAYWITKQAMMQRLGRKEDEHVVASDSELDAKLELFKSIQITCADMLRVIEKYQEKLCALSQAENEMGRFLKTRSSADKTQAGKMMCAVGKSLSFASQQRLALRQPLCRLYQEVETFRYRAISDTLLTIQRMESTRTDYRGALLWMKNQSEALDPDEFKRLEKFRKVQVQVRKTKEKFDRLKLDSMQKVDLLAASRCNMCSHVLAAYQTTLMQFWEKTSRTLNAVAESFKGYQYYEFNLLKDLTDESRKLAAEKLNEEEAAAENQEEHHDTVDDNMSNCSMHQGRLKPMPAISEATVEEEINLLGLNEDLFNFNGISSNEVYRSRSLEPNHVQDAIFQDQLDKLDEIFLREFKDSPDNLTEADMQPLPCGNRSLDMAKAAGKNKIVDKSRRGAGSSETDDLLAMEFDSLRGGQNFGGGSGPGLTLEEDPVDFLDKLLSFESDSSANVAEGLLASHPPQESDLHESLGIDWMAMQLNPGGVAKASQLQYIPSTMLDSNGKPGDKSGTGLAGAEIDGAPTGLGRKPAANKWLDLFADLDPLGNPDSICKKEGQISDA